jgi:hypothetical protein
MFGKKKQTLAPFALQVLTTEYLIHGTVDGNTHLYFPQPELQGSRPIPLTSVQIQPTRLLTDISPRTCTRFEVWGDSAVAFIPQVDISLLVDYDVWKIATIPLQGIFYFGPYLVHGTLMKLRDDTFETDVPMFDVHIISQAPGTHLGDIHAQFALMNIHWLHGYEPR